MNLYPLRAELAVMNILSEHRLAADDSLAQKVLAASWRRYGMREQDLRRAITRLHTLGMISFQQHGRYRHVTLTEAGCSWLRSAKGISARILLLPRLFRALVAGWRTHAGDPSLRRRRDDPPKPET